MTQQEKEKPTTTTTTTTTTTAIITPPQAQFINHQQEKEIGKDVDIVWDESGGPSSSSLAVSSRVLYLLGDITSGPAYRFAQWLDSIRKKGGGNYHRSSGFSNRSSTSELQSMILRAGEEPIAESKSSQQVSEISLWERLGKASMLNIDSKEFSWEMLSSLHRSEHSSSSTEHYSEDEMNKALEVTVNSGGVVFFALFNKHANDESVQVEAAAVIKIASSRMATQSERLGYEFAKRLGVRTPQARVVHNSSHEWQQIKDAAEKARDAAILVGDDAGEVTCSELLEALELSRCLFLMNYVHGSPLLESSNAFDSCEAAEKTAAALGRILMLDLVIRNEDRLPCRQLRWRGNSANLLLSAKAASEGTDTLDEAFDAATRRFGPRVIKTLQKERRSISVDGRLNDCDPELMPQSSDVSYLMGFRKTTNWNVKNQGADESESGDFDLVAIDSCIPRRPPAGKRTNDQANYPKLVELLLHSAEYSSSLLYGMTGGKVGYPLPIEADEQIDLCLSDSSTVVNEFRSGFRTALRDLQSFYIFLLTLYQKLDSLLRVFLTIINKNSLGDIDKDDCLVPESPSHAVGVAAHCLSPISKERSTNETHADLGDMELQRTIPRSSTAGNKESQDSASPASRENWHGRCSKGNGEPLRSLRLTTKLRDFNKYAKVDAELHKELEQWNEMLRTDAIKFCQDNNFNTGFFEGSENNSVVDAYELKVRLEHILERIALISDAANTEKPSSITGSLFIGGALAARSVHTLQHLGITHILCLCSNEIGQSDSQYPDLFEYKNFSICDSEDTNISNIFEEASDYIESIERSGGKVLVHCFEGKSRSATVVLAYLMLRKNFTLLKAWNTLKKAHRRAQPNDGFAKTLLDLDMKLHGKVSMEWQQRKPMMKVCPICGKNAGLSSSSLNLHLQKSHRKIISSGSVDSAMNMEIQKAVSELKISTSGNVSPPQKMAEGFNQ